MITGRDAKSWTTSQLLFFHPSLQDDNLSDTLICNLLSFSPNTSSWTTPVSLLPGTHHFKFIVDDQWRIADDYPTAVDDRDGSLANYVNVTLPSSGSPQTPAHTSPLQSPHHTQSHQLSFWSDSTATGSNSKLGGTTVGPNGLALIREADWTQVIPPELIQAAAEEENYLASADSPTSSSSVPAPNIPPAPLLPRHLDKLILNVRPATVTGAVPGSGSSSGGAAAAAVAATNGGVGGEKDKARRGGSRAHRRDRERENRARPTSNLGMTATPAETNATLAGSPHTAGFAEGLQAQSLLPPPLVLPVVTASGTDVTAGILSGPPTPAFVDSPEGSGPGTPIVAGSARKVTVASLGGPGLADDASVLPVPSHVVLHHLSTSAIRNGVLAVANTTRYRKKVCGSLVCFLCTGADHGLCSCSISRLSTTNRLSVWEARRGRPRRSLFSVDVLLFLFFRSLVLSSVSLFCFPIFFLR